MRDFEYIAPSFLGEESREDILSIRFSTGGLCFSVLRNGTIRVFIKESYTEMDEGDISDIVLRLLKEDPYASLKYHQVQIQYEKRDKLIIPEELLDDASLPLWMLTIHDYRYRDSYVRNRLDCMPATVVSSFPKNFIETVSSLCSNVIFTNSIVPFLKNSFESIKQNDQKMRIFIDLHATYIDTVLFRGHTLQSLDTFDTASAEDVLYYVISLLNAKNKFLSAECILSGESPFKNQIISLLSRYLVKVVTVDCESWKIFCPERIEQSSDFVYMLNSGI